MKYKPPPKQSRIADVTKVTVAQVAGPPPKQKTELPPARLQVINADEVVPEQVNWLWEDRFPLAMLSYVAGDAGQGKSLIFDAELPARVSVGAMMPDGTPGVEGGGDTVLFCGEDDTTTTTVPRLIRAGADLKRIKLVEAALIPNIRTGELERQQFDANIHVPLLAELLRTLKNPKLVVIDPVSEYMGASDTNKQNEVRNTLRKVVDLAAEFRVAVICLAHMNKGASNKAVYKAGGSVSFVALSRAYWMVGTDPDDEHRRYLLPAKINIAPQVGGLAYRIESDGKNRPPFIHWEADSVNMNGNKFLEMESKAYASKGKADDEGELARAKDFLKKQLAGGPMLSGELTAALRANDITQSTFKRAKVELEIRADRLKENKSPWWTLMPGQTIPEPKPEVQPSRHEIVEPLGPLGPLKQGSLTPEDQEDQEDQENNNKRVEPLADVDDGLQPNGKRRTRKPRKAAV